MANRTLQQLLAVELEAQGEPSDEIEQIRIAGAGQVETPDGTPVTYDELNGYAGDAGFGAEQLPRLYAWTATRVYFKSVYDGKEYVDSVPRHSGPHAPQHH